MKLFPALLPTTVPPQMNMFHLVALRAMRFMTTVTFPNAFHLVKEEDPCWVNETHMTHDYVYPARRTWSPVPMDDLDYLDDIDDIDDLDYLDSFYLLGLDDLDSFHSPDPDDVEYLESLFVIIHNYA